MTDEPTLALAERHADTDRNRILNIALVDLDRIINGHDPEVDTSINNMVWDRLDKMAIEIESLAHCRATPADDKDATIARLSETLVEIIEWHHRQMGNYPQWFDRARKAVGQFEGDAGAPPTTSAEAAENKLADAEARGFAGGIEAAAKIADDHTPTKHGGTLASYVTGTTIAKEIRALAPAPQGGPFQDSVEP